MEALGSWSSSLMTGNVEELTGTWISDCTFTPDGEDSAIYDISRRRICTLSSKGTCCCDEGTMFFRVDAWLRRSNYLRLFVTSE
jgi:hypothetical protein